MFIEPGERPRRVEGYATDIITDKTIDFIAKRDAEKPFFVMCHHKAPHRSWEYDPKHRDLYRENIRVPENFGDDYKNRAKAAAVARNKIAEDMTVGPVISLFQTGHLLIICSAS